MGLFSNFKKKKPEDTRQKARENLEKFDPTIRPGGVFMVQLLMKEKCTAPSVQRMIEILSKHLVKTSWKSGSLWRPE